MKGVAGALLTAPEWVVGQTPRVRKNVMNLDPKGPEMTALRNAISNMMKLQSGPFSWDAQASVHFDHCPHQNWFVLPWHRAYLRYFEAICAAQSGVSTFAIPYWDWSTHPTLPPMFFEPGPLSHPRDVNHNDAVSAEFAGSDVINKILGIDDFQTFGSGKPQGSDQREPAFFGQLEGTPHNNVHSFIGEDMNTYYSPKDPIFWLHHANIDRLWSRWQLQHLGKTPNDPDWLKHPLAQFTDANGSVVNPTVESVLDTAALGYIYDDQSIRLPHVADLFPVRKFQQEGPPEILASLVQTTSLHANQATVAQLVLRDTDMSSVRQEAIRSQVWVRTSGITDLSEAHIPAPASTDTVLVVSFAAVPSTVLGARVFLNCPHPTVDTPLTDPTYVGSLSFFGGDHSHGSAGPHSATYRLPLNATIRQMVARSNYTDFSQLSVAVVATPSKKASAAEQALTVTGYRIETV